MVVASFIAFSMRVSDFQAWCVICAVKFRSPHLDLTETEATNVLVWKERELTRQNAAASSVQQSDLPCLAAFVDCPWVAVIVMGAPRPSIA